jgi:hypothetical protein
MQQLDESSMMEPVVNKVAQSPIKVFNLEDLWDGGDVVEFDLAPFLDHGLILREKQFRESIKSYDWSNFVGKHVALHCSTDAIVPVWAYMLVASRLDGIAASSSLGSTEDLVRERFAESMARLDWSAYEDAIVVVKGCGSSIVPGSAYVAVIQRLQQVARKLMFGEPCSSVPLWRKPAATQAHKSVG